MLRQVAKCFIKPVVSRSAGVFVHRDTDQSNADVPFEWTEANLVRIEAIKNQYPQGKGYLSSSQVTMYCRTRKQCCYHAGS